MRPSSALVGIVVGTAVLLAGCTGGSEPEPTGSETSAVPASTEPSSSPGVTSSEQPDATSSPEENSSATPEPESTTRTASPTIEAIDIDEGLDELRVSAVIGGVSEDGGTCTVILSQAGGSDQVILTAEGIFNVNRTECFAATTLSSLASGTWSAKVEYSTSDTAGVSPTQEIEIP